MGRQAHRLRSGRQRHEALAKKQKFSSITLLLTRAATAQAVSDAILGAAKALKSGDLFFLTYSGHGGQVDDTNSEEKDRMDETWVCYDRQLIDDQLYELWGKFKASVRILVLSDSCHSGTVSVRFRTSSPERSMLAPATRRMIWRPCPCVRAQSSEACGVPRHRSGE